MSKYSVGEEYWQIGKECYAKYIKEDDDRIGGLIVTYRGDLNTYGIDCGLLIDSAHTMLTALGFEEERQEYIPKYGNKGVSYYCFDKKSKYYGMYIGIDYHEKEYVVGKQIDDDPAEVEWVDQPLHAALTQLMREQAKWKKIN